MADADEEDAPLMQEEWEQHGHQDEAAMEEHRRASMEEVMGEVHEADVDEGGDLIQFMSPENFCLQTDAFASIMVMRIGACKEPCAASFSTQSSTANNEMYESTHTTVFFKPGEEFFEAKVPLLKPKGFDTTREFLVFLDGPMGCDISRYGGKSSVKIIATDVFPHESYRQQIENNVITSSGFGLVISFWFFLLRVIPTVRKKTLMTMFLDQFQNLNYLVQINLRVYLVNVVLAINDPDSEKHLCFNSRELTGISVAIAVVVPQLMNSYIHWQKIKRLSLRKTIRRYMKGLIFSTYLNYNQKSFHTVSKIEIMQAANNDIDEVVEHGFYGLLEVSVLLGQLVLGLLYLGGTHPKSLLPLLGFPVAMKLIQNFRYHRTVELQQAMGKQEDVALGLLTEACNDVDMIHEFKQRAASVIKYENALSSVPSGPLQQYEYITNHALPWTTMAAIAFYMILGVIDVCKGELSVGGFLAVLNIYKDFGALFEKIFDLIKAASRTIAEILGLINILNQPLDSAEEMARLQKGMKVMTSELQSTRRITSDGKPYSIELDTADGSRLGADISDNIILAVSTGGHFQKWNDANPMFRVEAGAKILEVNGIRDDIDAMKNAYNSPGVLKMKIRPSVISLSHFDALTLRLENVPLAYNTGGPPSPLQDVTVSVKQGCLVAILGNHGSGKSTLMRFIAGSKIPHSGRLVRPAHLRTLQVLNTPVIIQSGGLHANFTYGADKQDVEDMARIKRICKRLGVQDHVLEILDEENRMIARGEEVTAETSLFKLSHNDLRLVSLVRALIISPEILLLHRPFDEMEARNSASFLDILREYAIRGGIEKNPKDATRVSAKHTVFFTSGQDREVARAASDVADVVWRISHAGGLLEEKGGQMNAWNHYEHDARPNLIVKSWSHEAVELRNTLKEEQNRLKQAETQIEIAEDEILYSVYNAPKLTVENSLGLF